MLDSVEVIRSAPINVASVPTAWGALMFSAVLTGVAAYAAAVAGAKEGGKQATGAMLTTMREEDRLRREASRDQLVQRLRFVLPRISGIGHSLNSHDLEHPIQRDILEEVGLMWLAYDRISDFGTHLNAPEFEARVRSFLMDAATTAKLGIEIEERDLSMKIAGHPAYTGDRANRGTVQRRRRVLDAARAWEGSGDALNRDLDRLAAPTV